MDGWWDGELEALSGITGQRFIQCSDLLHMLKSTDIDSAALKTLLSPFYAATYCSIAAVGRSSVYMHYFTNLTDKTDPIYAFVYLFARLPLPFEGFIRPIFRLSTLVEQQYKL